MTRVRQHRGSLSEAMETVFEVADFAGLVDHMKKTLEPYGKMIKPEDVKVEHYTWDGRIGWDTYIVSIDGYGVWGFTDGPLRPPCIGNDPLCPCQDGDMCHYKGPGAWPIPEKRPQPAPMLSTYTREEDGFRCDRCGYFYPFDRTNGAPPDQCENCLDGPIPEKR